MLDDTREALLAHYARYPKLCMEDAVKLLYQSEFAGGHMIEDEAQAIKRLKAEYTVAGQDDVTEGFEDIGGGLCRLNLRVLNRLGIEEETAARFFISTANSVRGNAESFEEKLGVFLECCHRGELPFSYREAEAYIIGLKSYGYPPVSHSPAYRESYSPAYRVVKCEFREFIEVFSRIDFLLKIQQTVTVGIDGNSGAGKSTLTDLIDSVYDCNVFHMDDFFLRPEQRTEERLREPGGNVDYERFRDEVIRGIAGGEKFEYRRYDCKSGRLVEPMSIMPERLSIIEGSYSMHPSISGKYDLKVFLQIDEEEQRKRIFSRSSEMYQRFINEWIPMENLYFDKMNIMEKCDIIYRNK